ncbi:MAG: phage holin family protein [Flavobacteriaceae bacterium]|nr:phage holin family protein [Flavobacteriaceae bacterium]
MKTILKILLTAFAVVILAYFLPGVTVESPGGAVIVAVVLALLRLFVKPVLVLLTLPVTVLSLGLFLWVINALMILLVDSLVDEFKVSGFWVALLFSLLLSFFQSILYSFLKETK